MTDTYHVWCPDYWHKGPKDGMPIHGAYDAGQAAETWAERFDHESGDSPIIGGSEAKVMVKGPDGEITKWAVCGESVPSYSAMEAK